MSYSLYSNPPSSGGGYAPPTPGGGGSNTNNNGGGASLAAYQQQLNGGFPSSSSSSAGQLHSAHHLHHAQAMMGGGAGHHHAETEQPSSPDDSDDEHASKVNRAPVCKISKADWTRIYKFITKREIWNKPSSIYNALGELGIEVKMKPKAFQAQWNTRRSRLEQFANAYLAEKKKFGSAVPQDISAKTLKSFSGLQSSVKKFEDPEAALTLGLLIVQRRKSTEPSALSAELSDLTSAAVAASTQLSKKMAKEEVRLPSTKSKKDKKEKREKDRKKHKKLKSLPAFGEIGSDGASGSMDDFMQLSPRKRSKSKSGSKKKKARRSKASGGLSDSDISSIDSDRSSSDSAPYSSSKTDVLMNMVANMNQKFDKLTESINLLVNKISK